MDSRIYGKRKLDFMTTDEPPRHILGTTIWYGVKNDGVEGVQVEKGFVSADKVAYKDIAVDTDVDITFDYKGRIDSIDMIL